MNAKWWGEFQFGVGETRHWRIGPFDMWMSRLESEFRIATSHDLTSEPYGLVAGGITHDPVPEAVETVRYGVRDDVSQLTISPATADRAAIFKSESTYIVPPGGAVTAFLSAPIWVRVQLTNPVRPLHEESSLRPSDTWFGPSTLDGELCYAIRTTVRYNLDNLSIRPFRAITVVKIVNHADTALPLARLRLPLPQLSLYANREGYLWTEAVTFDRHQDGDMAEVELSRSAPDVAGECTRVCEPRGVMESRPLIRSFTSLLGLTTD